MLGEGEGVGEDAGEGEGEGGEGGGVGGAIIHTFWSQQWWMMAPQVVLLQQDGRGQ